MTASTLPNHRLLNFIGGSEGAWQVQHCYCINGAPLLSASKIAVIPGPLATLPGMALWALRGITSNERYVIKEEKSILVSKQEGLGRPSSTCAALIPIRKSAAWWALAQDERRQIFEAQSRHIAIGLNYLPAIARRLHHCRDISPDEPFDFITWFEYAPSDSVAFDELLRALRASPEWEFVERETDIRLIRLEC